MHRDQKFMPAAAMLVLWGLVIAGCGKREGLPLAPVTGVVTLDGKPVKAASLEFIPQGSGGSVAYGTTDDNGRYKMYSGSSGTGAVIGKTWVRITSDDNGSVGGQDFAGKEVFPENYNVKSDLFVDVVQGSNSSNFDCKSDGAPPRARQVP